MKLEVLKDCYNTQPCCMLRRMPQCMQFSVKPYLPGVPQNVNPRDGVAFGSNLFGVASKEKSFVNCNQIHIYLFYSSCLSVKY